MAWVKTSDRLPPDGVVVRASNQAGTLLPMRVRDGEWFYSHRWEKTKFKIVMWFEGTPKIQTESYEPRGA